MLDVARTYPQVQVTGFDSSVWMIEYTRAQALTQELKHASFRVMDALKPLDFPDESFDLINARSILHLFLPRRGNGSSKNSCASLDQGALFA